MTPFGRLVRDIEPHGLLTLGDQIVTYQCHHHSLFLDQTVSDALGGEGVAVRRQAAFEASHALVASFCAEFGILAADDRLELASELFGAMGHGRLTFEVTPEGGVARGDELHYGAGFRDKYGTILRNRRPIDTFASGFVAASSSLAFPSDWGTLEAEETSCVGRRDGACVFSLARRPERPRFGAVVTRQLVEDLAIDEGSDRASSDALRAASDLGRLLSGAQSDEQGVIRAFGVRLALVPASYIGQITFDTIHLVEKRAPELFPIAATLIQESAQIGAFHLLGGILASPAWHAEHGPIPLDPEDKLEELLGMARALGWGSFHASDFVPGRSLVLKSPVTHESAYYGTRHGNTVRRRLFFQQGLALAIMQLLHHVDFTAEQPIGPETYDSLFRSGPRFHVEETRSPLRGDRGCEVVVEADRRGIAH